MASLEDYELGRVLARGGMGVVHEAIERASGRHVALKRILPHALDPDAIARFMLEGRAVARLTDGGIVQVHAMGEAPGGPFMVMDLVEGQSLQRVLDREGPLAPARALELAREVARALAHAHERGVLHRDLKPANVLVDETGRARLIDFGLAKLQVGAGSLAQLTRTGELVGTPAFMAPEQANSGASDARTDVYGLGATLFALLTGRPPFGGTHPIAVLQAVLEQPAPPPSRFRPGLPAALDDLVLACLAKDPAARPASMGAVLARLEGLDVTGRRAVPWKTVVAALAAGALIALGVVAFARREPVSPTVLAPPPPPMDVPTETLDAVARKWLDASHARARAGDLEGALRAPARDAPAAAWLAHGRALLSAGRASQALEALRNPSLDPAARDVVLARFQVELALDPTRADTRDLDAAIARDPRWAEGLYERERHRFLTAHDRDRLREGVKALRGLGAEAQAVRLSMQDIERLSLAAHTLKGDLDQIRDDLVSADTAGAELLTDRADLRQRLGDRNGAEEDLTRALELDPLLARAYSRRASTRRELQRCEEAARDLLRQGALLGPTEAGEEAVLAAASQLLQAGRLPEALAVVEASRRRRVTALTEKVRGDALRALGRPDDATKAYQHIFFELLPGRASEYNDVAGALETLGYPQPDWMGRYVEVLRRDAASDQTRWLQFVRFLRSVRAELALEVATETIARWGDCADAFAERSVIREQLHDLSGALEDARVVERLLPGMRAGRVAALEARLRDERARRR